MPAGRTGPPNLRPNARFADIVMDEEDSRVLDFSRFNETGPCTDQAIMRPPARPPGTAGMTSLTSL